MPKFTTTKSFFDSLLQRELPLEELEPLLCYAKGELDDYNPSTDEIRIELNDTNRPDLWSAAGLARQLRAALNNVDGGYDFFSLHGAAPLPHDTRVIEVEKGMSAIRPYIVAFEAHGPRVSDAMLKELIHTQERLAWNYGRKRKSIAMGIYPAAGLRYPLHYRACDPQQTKFTPLGMSAPLSLRDILATHPKGKEFGHLIRDLPRYPVLADANGAVLSMPPVINSADAGEVRVGEGHLFVELTGDTLANLHTANNIVACNLADMGFTIRPVRVQYATQEHSYTTPHNLHAAPYVARMNQIHKLLGVRLSKEQVIRSIARMGMVARIQKEQVHVTLPPWRNDYLHEVDVIEDVMIGTGVEAFTPQPMSDFTVGQLLPIEHLSRKVVRIMVGLGFQEMIHNYLVSDEDSIHKMYPQEQWPEVKGAAMYIDNPRSERHNMVRGSILPSLLASCSVSAQALLPHKIFEVGKTLIPSADDNYGSRTQHTLGVVDSAAAAQFTTINEQLSAIMYYLGLQYTLEECQDGRFITGRCAAVHYDGTMIGVMGELHPRVLEAWGVGSPSTACEIDVEALLQ